MTPNEVLNELRGVQERYKNRPTPTFSICISDMAKDSADAIESLQTFVDYIRTLSTCNDCHNQNCGYRPAWFDGVRYNCPLYKGENNEQI